MVDRGADVKHVRVRGGSTSSALTSQTMPPELMAEAARRLPWLGLVFSVTYILNRLGQRTVMGLTGTILPGPAIQDAFDVAAVMLGIAVFLLAPIEAAHHRAEAPPGAGISGGRRLCDCVDGILAWFSDRIRVHLAADSG